MNSRVGEGLVFKKNKMKTELKKSLTVNIFSNTSRFMYAVEIFPFEICGNWEYNRSFELQKATGCPLDSNHYGAGGRSVEIIEVPKGYRMEMLTKGGVAGLVHQLPNDGQTWVTADTVHCTWKIRCNQGVVLVRDTKYIDVLVTRHQSLSAYLKELGYTFGVEITHVEDTTLIQGKTVAGVLPMWLAELCHEFTEITLSIPPEMRGIELSIEQMHEYFKGISTYQVNRVG